MSLAQVKHNYKTLFSRHGQLSIDEPEKKRNLPQAAYLSIAQELLNRYSTINTKRVEYVSYEEFDELREEVNTLKEQLSAISTINLQKNLAIKDAYIYLRKIPEVEDIIDISREKEIVLQLNVKKFSRTLFRKIANIEIELVKKYSNLNFDIHPVLSEKPQNGCEINDDSTNSTKSKA